ncbi:MAG: hypothetical protein COB81_09490 [Flavobacteriaceae bacterium]|nr:MAG: hypothetical protein COB81_09490 [Flavobacteriaceae bacterium]
MKLAKRFFYYGIGLSLGCVVVYFISTKKNTQSFDYFPNARTLKNIRLKKNIYSPEAIENMATYNLDSTDISLFLSEGSVDFKNSNKKVDSCKSYQIEAEIKNKDMVLYLLNCKNTTRIQKIALQQD